MPTPLPPEVTVQSTPTGVMYLLPKREAGWLKKIANLLTLIGLILIGVALYLILFPTGLYTWLMDQWSSGGQAGSYDFTNLFGAFFALPCLFFGIPLLKFGRFLSGGKTSIELRSDQLITTQGSGPLRRRRKYNISKIKKLQVKTARPGEAPDFLSNIAAALNITLTDGKTRNLTWGYKQELLLALATDISAQVEQQAGATLFESDQTSIAVEERTLGDNLVRSASQHRNNEPQPSNQYETPPRPDDAVSTLEYNSDGLTITVPPVGMRKGSKGMFGFSIIWNLFMSVFTIGTIAGGAMTDPDAWVVWLIVPLFWTVGIWMALAAINAGKRRAILDVVGDTLLITRKSIFKTRQEEVHRDEIESIRRDASGTEVNDVPILNLQIHRKQGKKIALLSQLSNDELAWIAGELRSVLAKPRDASQDLEANQSNDLPRPASAIATLEKSRDGITITVPPVGILKASKGLFGFAIVWNLIIAIIITVMIFVGAFKQWTDLLFIIPFLGIFLLIGIGMLLGAINAGRRRAILDVVGDTLLITRKNIFKTLQDEVHRDNIASIRRDESGTRVNDIPILNLQIHRKQGRKITMLSQLRNEELAWIASELRKAMGIDC